jgi:hypothetical protein
MGISPRRGLDESDTAFHRAVVHHLGEFAVDVLLRIVVGPPLGADFRAVKRAVRKAYPSLCRDCVHETKGAATTPRRSQKRRIPSLNTAPRNGPAPLTQRRRAVETLAEVATNAVRRAAGEKALETICRKAT